MKEGSSIFFIEEFEKSGSQFLIRDYRIDGIKLEMLQKIFEIDPNDPDIYIREIVYPLEITEKHAKALTPYINFEFDFSKYDYMLDGRGNYSLSN